MGADYERGLDMLKAYVEESEVPSKLEFTGNQSFEGGKYVGIKTSCSLDDVGPKMEADFGKLNALMQEKGISDVQMATIYHKWNIPKNSVAYTACLISKEAPSDISSGFVTGEIPSTSCYVLRHVGSYKHLGNAWSTLYTMQRSKEFKVNKGIHPFELYQNNPQTTAEKDLITDVYFPIK